MNPRQALAIAIIGFIAGLMYGSSRKIVLHERALEAKEQECLTRVDSARDSVWGLSRTYVSLGSGRYTVLDTIETQSAFSPKLVVAYWETGNEDKVVNFVLIRNLPGHLQDLRPGDIFPVIRENGPKQ